MKLNVFSLLFKLLFAFHLTTGLQFLNGSDIYFAIRSSCVVLGQKLEHHEDIWSIVEKLNQIYAQDDYVTVAGGEFQLTRDEEAEILLYPKLVTDCTCLIQPDVEVPPKAIPYKGKLQIDQLVSFINYNCNAYRERNGHFTSSGLLRQQIIAGLYQPQKQISSCERTSFLTKSTFFWEYLSRSQPVVIEGAVKSWPAIHKWTIDYLQEMYGEKKVHVKLTRDGNYEGVEPATIWPGYTHDWIPDRVRNQLQFPDLVVVRPATDEMKMSDFLNLVTSGLHETGISAYLEYSSIPAYMAELEEDIDELPFVSGLLERRHLNIWLSDGNTLGKLHFDPFDNFLCQLSGEKHLVLFDPHNNENLYESHIPEAILGYVKANKTIYRKSLLESTSMVMSPVDILKPDYNRFPKFSQAKRLECVLKPGDALFMPAFWWHEVQSYPDHKEHRNLAVNYWYEPFLTKEFPCPECKLDVNTFYRNLLETPPNI